MQKTAYWYWSAELKRQSLITKLPFTSFQDGKKSGNGSKLIIRAMKLTMFIMTVLLLQVSAISRSQKITFSGKDVTLHSLFQEIKKQTGYVVVVNKAILEKSPHVSLSVTNMSLNEVLQIALKNHALDFTIGYNTVIISKKPEPIVLPFELAETAQAFFPISGIVRDEEGKPLRGATVMLSGKNNRSTTTNESGEFTLEVNEGDVIIVSYIGYENREVVIQNQRQLVIALVQKVGIIDSVVISNRVNTGYQRILPQQVTGAISQMNRKEYESRINTDFLSGLQNKIPGMLINNDVTFQGNSLFQIRGIATITGNPKPLIVLDGYPTDLSLNDINPNEIETVTVLKDAAAAAIYGVRASNGVVIIDRKKGTAGDARFSFRGTMGIRPHENYKKYRYDQGTIGLDYVRDYYEDGESMTLQIYKNWILDGSMSAASLIFGSEPTQNLLLAKAIGEISQEQFETGFANLGKYNNTEDYERLFLRNAVTQQYNLNVSGGTNKALYYITGNYLGNRLNQKNNADYKVQLSGRSNFVLSKRLSAELLTDYNETVRKTAPVPDINEIYADEQFTDANGNPLAIIAGSSYSDARFDSVQRPRGFYDQRMFPLVEMNEVTTRQRMADYRINLNLKYNLAKGLDLSLGGIYETSKMQQRRYASESSALTRQIINTYVILPIGSTPINYVVPKGGYLQQEELVLRSYTVRAQVTYNKHLTERHSINAILGAEGRNGIQEGSRAATFGYNNQSLLQQPTDYARMFNSTAMFNGEFGFINTPLSYSNLFVQTYNEDRFVSGYMNAVYAYMDRFSLTGSIRIDQTNLFGTDPKYRYKPLWSLGVAWNVERENFMEEVTWVDALKLRMAYGFNGNVSKASLPQVIAQYDRNTVLPQSTEVLTLVAPANGALRWEQTANFNIGTDFSLLKNISGSIDFYNRKGTDILANMSIAPSKGVRTGLVNRASINNRGWELALRADWLKGKNLNFNTGLVMSHNTSKVLDVYIPQQVNSATPVTSQAIITAAEGGYMKGQPVGVLYSYRYAGINDAGNALYFNSKGEKVLLPAGDEGFGSLITQGTSIPSINLGWSNRFDIGNFYFYCMLNYYGGFSVRTPVPNIGIARPMEGAGNYWRKPGDELLPDIKPSILYSGSYTRYIGNSDRYTMNGAYLTVGDITVSYNLRNADIVKRAGFSDFEIKAQASNVYTVGFNKDNYSLATGSYLKRYITPTYTIGIFTNF